MSATWEERLDWQMGWDNSDPLHHHVLLNFRSIIRETEKAYFIEMDMGRMWIPISICRFMNEEKREVWVHRKTFRKLNVIPVAYSASEEFS